MAWSKLVDLSYSADEIEDRYSAMADEVRPSCPSGLCMRFTDRELDKLGLDEMPDKGDMIDLRAFGTVVHAENGRGGRVVEIQFDKIAVENEMTESEDC